MRRTRAIGLFGLVLGLSGCAGTHQHQHFPVSGVMPHGPHGQVKPNCGCRTAAVVPAVGVGRGVGAGAGAGVAVGARPAAVVATVASRPGFPPMTPAPRASLPPTSTTARPAPPPQASATWTPPASCPVAVPAPAGTARCYFPSFEGDGMRSVWDAVPPDLLGVRTSMVPAAAAEDAPAAPGREETPDSLSLQPPGSSSSSSESVSVAQNHAEATLPFPLPPPDHPSSAAAPGAPGASQDHVMPVSAEVSLSPPANASTGLMPPPGTVDISPAGPELAVTDATAEPAKTLVLEHADESALAGRPRLQPPAPAEPPLVQHDQDEPSTWVSALAFQRPKNAKPSGTGLHLASIVRGDVRPAEPRRTTVVGRFIRRVQGAGRAFLDPESVGREAGDFPQQGQGQGVERASAHRLGEAPKR